MLKYLTIFAVLSFIAPVMSGQPNQASNHEQSKAKQSQPSIFSANTPNETKRAYENQRGANADPPQRYAAIKRPEWWSTSEWWLVIIAGLTAGVIGWQSWATTKSAKAAMNSAQAALDQIRMVKSKERARLMVVVTSGPDIGEPELNIDNFQMVTVKVSVVNVGPTKAYNVEAFGELVITKRIDETPWEVGLKQEIPATIGNTDDVDSISVSVSGLGVVARAGGFIAPDGRAFDQATIGKIKRGEVFFQINGLLAYDDVYGESHRTPFKLIWQRLGICTDPSWPEEWDWIDASPKST